MMNNQTAWANGLLQTFVLEDAKQKLDSTLYAAVEYALLSGGKRVRPCLMLKVADMLALAPKEIAPFAAALECIHSYSLVHDDLPGMDNDTLRRGKPTVHVQFSEAVAILVGDYLLTRAFAILLDAPAKNEAQNAAKRYLATMANEMVDGQAREFAFDTVASTLPKNECEKRLTEVYHKKTAALMRAATVIPALLAGKDISLFEKMGENIGMLFQLSDDVIDLLDGTDKDKRTLVALNGVEKAREALRLLEKETVSLLLPFANSEVLVAFVKSLTTRTV